MLQLGYHIPYDQRPTCSSWDTVSSFNMVNAQHVPIGIRRHCSWDTVSHSTWSKRTTFQLGYRIPITYTLHVGIPYPIQHDDTQMGYRIPVNMITQVGYRIPVNMILRWDTVSHKSNLE